MQSIPSIYSQVCRGIPVALVSIKIKYGLVLNILIKHNRIVIIWDTPENNNKKKKLIKNYLQVLLCRQNDLPRGPTEESIK